MWLVAALQSFKGEAAEGSHISVHSDLTEVVADPGQVVTRSLLIENAGATAVQIDDTCGLPTGWGRAIPGQGRSTIEAGGVQTRLLSIRVPKSASVGRYLVRFSVTDINGERLAEAVEIPIGIRPRGGLEAFVTKPPQAIVNGESILFTLTINNRGNCATSTTIECRLSPEANLKLSERVVDLPPGATREVSVQINTDGTARKSSFEFIQLTLASKWDGGHSLLRLSPILVEIFPGKSEAFDPYRRMPLRVSSISAWNSKVGFSEQTEIAGGTWLDDARTRRLELIVRPAGFGPASEIYNQPEQYGIRYSTPEISIQAGDESFSLSPLTRSRSIERGFQMDWSPGLTSGGILFASGRPGAVNGDAFGGYLRRQFSDHFSLQANLLEFEFGTNRIARRIASLGVALVVTNRLHLRIELGEEVGATNLATGVGWQTEGWAKPWSGAMFRVNYLHAGSSFPGANSDVDGGSATISQEISRRLRIEAMATAHASNLIGDSERSFERRSELKGGVRYQLFDRTEGLLEISQRNNLDVALPLAVSALRSDVIRFALARESGPVSLRFTQELGMAKFESPILRFNDAVEHTGILARWTPSPSQVYSLNLGYGDGLAAAAAGRVYSEGLNATWNLGNRIKLSAAIDMIHGSSRQPERKTLGTRVEWRRENHQTLSAEIRMRRSSNRPGTEASVMAVYTIPFEAPLGKRGGVGTIEGTIVDGDLPESPGIPRVAVRLNTGDKSVADRFGRFLFDGLKPGDYSISVDFQSLPFSKIFAESQQLPLSVRKDSVTRTTLKLVTAGAVQVQLTIFEDSPELLLPLDGSVAGASGNRRAIGGLQGEVVEISNEHEQFRRQTSGDGMARFVGIRPGTWSLKVYDSVVPAFHTVENPSRTIQLRPAAVAQEIFRIIPRQRKMRQLQIPN